MLKCSGNIDVQRAIFPFLPGIYACGVLPVRHLPAPATPARSRIFSQVLRPCMHSNAMTALTMMKRTKRYCMKVIGALACTLSAENVMNIRGAFTKPEVSADDTAQSGHMRKMVFFCFCHAAPAALKAEAPASRYLSL